MPSEPVTERLSAVEARTVEESALYGPTSAIWVRFDHDPTNAQLATANHRLRSLVNLGVVRARVVLGGVVFDWERKVAPAANPETVSFDAILTADPDGTWHLNGETLADGA
jgi:hypothetical protein